MLGDGLPGTVGGMELGSERFLPVVTGTTERRVVVGGVGLRVRVRGGDPGRTPFLLVHGLASNALLWDGVARRLAAVGHPSAAVDLRAHGESDRVDGPFDFATLAADLAAVVDEVVARPVVAAGQSWGANVVLELAARFPDRVCGVVAVDGGFVELASRFPDWEEARRVLAPPSFEGLTAADLAAGAAARFDGWPPEGVAGQLANFEELADGTVRPRLSFERHMAILAELYGHRPLDAALRVRAPLVLVAADDGTPGKRAAVEEFAAAAGAEVRVLAGDHDLHAQRPGDVAAILLDLADRLP